MLEMAEPSGAVISTAEPPQCIELCVCAPAVYTCTRAVGTPRRRYAAKFKQHSITVHNHCVRQVSQHPSVCPSPESNNCSRSNKNKGRTNILWLSVKGAFLCFDALNLAFVSEKNVELCNDTLAYIQAGVVLLAKLQ